jgi:6-phosphogluconolactonase/glucosamine-6-phosphate isomerase/deaminase
MRFLKVEDWQPGIDALQARLIKELGAGKKTLWFVSGGSNVHASVSIMNSLPDELTEQLSVLLIDERYGLPGHQDSNYKQLHDAGFEHKQSTFIPVLAEGLNMLETAQRYAEVVERALDHADIVLSQLGIGADGHVSGILPDSPAVNAPGLVTSYSSDPYARITTTFDALRRIDADYSFVFGPDKQAMLARLMNEAVPLEKQPSQILKELPEAYVYNDQIGKEAV